MRRGFKGWLGKLLYAKDLGKSDSSWLLGGPTRQKHVCCLAPRKDEGKKGDKILEGSSQAIPGLKKLARSVWNWFSSGSAAL